MPKLYTNAQIRELERLVCSTKTDDEQGLMTKAGTAAFTYLKTLWPNNKKIIVCCGKGNNGGDGFIVAKVAKENGYDVRVVTITDIDELAGAAKWAAEQCLQAGVDAFQYHPDFVFDADIIVDALLGSGLTGEVKEPYLDCIERINHTDAFILSLDVPSGLNVDTGSVHGAAVSASATITFIGLKQGLFTHKGPAHCGEISVNDLQISDELFNQIASHVDLMEWSNYKKFLPKRDKDVHKGHYGHVLIIGGDYGMGGAVRLAAEAAMRVGAGLVTVATRPEHVNIVSGCRPEIMCHQVANPDDLAPLLERSNVIAIGPGLGRSEWAQDLLHYVTQVDQQKVLDADALNLLSQNPLKREDWILTPHPGEAARLLNTSSQDVQSDRFKAMHSLLEAYGGAIILKGAGSLIQSTQSDTHICPAGNPGMASGGMGDILTGVVAALLAQGLSLEKAAEVGAFIHSMTGDLAAEQGGERGLLATDLMHHLRELVNPE